MADKTKAQMVLAKLLPIDKVTPRDFLDAARKALITRKNLIDRLKDA